MKLKNKKRLLDELARSCASPKEFITYVMTLQGQTAADVIKDIDMTSAHFYVVMNTLSRGKSIGIKVCAKIAKGLDIDAHILNRLIADYSMNQYLNTVE